MRKTAVFCCPSSCSLISKIRGWAARGPVGAPNGPSNPPNDKLGPKAKLLWRFRRARTSKARCLHALPVFRSFSCQPNTAPASRQSYIRKTAVFCPSSCSLIRKIRGWAAKGPVSNGAPNGPTNPPNDKLEPKAKLLWRFRRTRTHKARCLHAPPAS